MSKPSSQSTPRIALIGPVAPFRGGIAQYTTQLHEAFATVGGVHTISFKRLYPAWLYPGKSDKEPGAATEVPGVSYMIDVYSPLSLKRTVNDIVKSGCQVAILSWWTLIWQPGMAYMARSLRRRGVKVVFLCHNLFDHDAKGLKRAISETLLKQADAYIVHSSEEKKMLASIHPDAPVLQRILPVYGQFPPAAVKLEKRGRLELLLFGFIRPYKGLEVLVTALKQLQDHEVYLTVVGESWGDVEAYKKQLLDMGAPNLELHLEYVDNETAANYFARADVVALPYLSATGSAVLSLAYHYKKPVLASRVGGLPDGVIEGKTGWLVSPKSPEALAEAIKGITRKQATAMASEVDAFCHIHSWANMAKTIRDFAQQLAE
jgi:glycosyltransferase involved in cell wall biosynthesis